jgi:hypothetical protein
VFELGGCVKRIKGWEINTSNSANHVNHVISKEDIAISQGSLRNIFSNLTYIEAFAKADNKISLLK